MLIGCRRQFYDVDFLSEQRRSTTTRRWADEVRIRCVPYKQAIMDQEGWHRKSRVTRIVSLLLSVHAAGVGALCVIGQRGFPERVLVEMGALPFGLVAANTSMAPLARAKSIKAICGPAPPAPVCIVRACPTPVLHPHLVHLAAGHCNRPFCLGMSSNSEWPWHVWP
ncbi:hypothetical protein J3F84DRAFT_220619 [Trichoderma pleuroticola]